MALNNSFLRIGLILFTVGIISLLFPRSQKIEINARTGTVWIGQDYLAPFDFNVSLSPAEIQDRKNDINKGFPQVIVHTYVDPGKITNAIIEANEGMVNLENPIRESIASIYQKTILANRLNKGKSYIVYEDGNKRDLDISSVIDRKQLDLEVRNKLEALGFNADSLNAQIWKSKLVPNAKVDNKLRQDLLEEEYSNIDNKGKGIFKGQVILRKGEVVTNEQIKLISDLRNAATEGKIMNKYSYLLQFLGYLLLTVLIIGALILYVRKYFNPIYNNSRSLSFILLWPLLFSLIVFGVGKNQTVSYYLIPFCIGPIVIKNFYGERLALFVHIVTVLIASYLSKQGYEFTFLQILAGVTTVLFVSETRFMDKFFTSILFIFLAYTLGHLGLSIINSSSLEPSELSNFLWLGLNAILLLLAYPIIPLIEKVFGFTSNITLAELGDMNNPLLKEMSLKAPGTLQHSLQVANLSEAAADKIGANGLLVKTAALYHDIGKMLRPQYFIENSKNSSLHETLSDNFESAKIIIDHVIEGEKMAKKAKLPKVIIDIIKTHHGTSRVEYFYRNQMQSDPDREFDASLFQYPGPLPTSKEETIVMIADTLEAAAKSLQNPNENDIDALVDKLVRHKIENGQMENSQLSFSELEECVNIFKSLLKSIYHIRIEYPEEAKTVKSL